MFVAFCTTLHFSLCATYDPDLDRAARRREQNRIAQRNHRRRKQLARQNQLQQSSHQQPQQHHEPQQLWPTDCRMNHDDDDETALSFSFKRQLWEGEPTTTTMPKQGGRVNDGHIGEMQPELLDVFDSLTQEPPSANWDPEPIYPSPSTDNEPPREVNGTASKNITLQPVLAHHERRTPNDSGRELDSRRERLALPTASPPMMDSCSHAQSIVELSSRPAVEPLSRCPTRDSRLQQLSPSMSIVDHEELERRSLSGRARTSSFRQRQPRRPCEHNSHYQARTMRSESQGQTCLHLAAAKGSCALIRYFLGRGMRPDTRDGEGLTALHHAIRGGHEDTVNTLLLGGADIEVTDSHGRTALHYAVEQRQDNIVILLIHKGANMHATVSGPIR
ncbi:hypothetical protein CISG_00521 [Coccidioides immitis RMSCC 3703]|uniref:BZIP domain-containing protein n=1 Tax=Coccidioides immitis RMSCC 3703 TaxID=454286 RepID=A0A0J8TF34_COCIT|nr:hypothetical protein CISG_00521 [Coccidioides immitis RMSCC 3703]